MPDTGLLLGPERAPAPAPGRSRATVEIPRGLLEGLTELATLPLGGLDPASVLRVVAGLSVSSIGGCEGAGISRSLAGGAFSSAAHHGPLALTADSLQRRVGEGPGIEVATRGLALTITHMAVETRWPRFCPQAASSGVRSACSVPLVAGARLVGSLNLYSGRDHAFSETGEAAAMLFARHAAVTIANVELYAASLRRARRAEEESLTDTLTGLDNRRAWDRILETEEVRCKRYQTSASVVVVDLDSLKHINDTHGHAAGDALLRRMGDTLRSTSREPDIVARIGGDEFAVLAVDCDNAQAEALVARFEAALAGAGISASLGRAIRRPECTLERTYWCADQAMLAGKKRKRMPRAVV